MNKQELCQSIKEAAEILRENHLSDENLQKQLDAQQTAVLNFAANIVFVGEFSAGKTALLNSFLGNEEILKENIRPETAIATEIIYGAEEKVVRVPKQSGKEDVRRVEEIADLSPEGFRKYIYMLNKKPLQDIDGLVLVDMPGFDSGIEAHNRALMQYIGEAAAYVFVINMEKGTVGQSSLDFLSEIQSYESDVSFILTKRDKLASENIFAVADHIRATLYDALGKEPPVLILSARDDDAGTKIESLLHTFSPDGLMMQKMGGDIILLLRRGLQNMEAQHAAINLDSRNIDIAIEEQKRKKEEIVQEMRREKKKLHNRLQIDTPNAILDDVEAALRNQIETLTQIAKQGSEPFQRVVTSIVRPVLLQSTQKNIEASFEEYLTAIAQFQEEQNSHVDVEGTAEKVRAVVTSVKTIAKAGAAFAKARKYAKMYKLFSTGLALTTSVVAPWMELIIIFLPEIMEGLSYLAGQSREEKLQKHIERTVIPEICEKLRPEILSAMVQTEEEQAEAIEREYQAAVDNEIEALQALKEEKEEKELDTERKKAHLADGIERMEKIIRCIEEAYA